MISYLIINNITKVPVYKYKLTTDKETAVKEIQKFKYTPLISIIIPVYNVDPKWLGKAIKSVENQYYKNWEICIADDCSTNSSTVTYLKKIQKENIKVKFLSQNGHISVASNEALSLAKGDYIALLDNDDELTVDALYEVVKAINKTGAEFIYSDEDKIAKNGEFVIPHFKSDFSIDQFLSINYLCHLACIKREIVLKVNGFEKGLEGSQDYDLFLKVIEQTDKIHHIPKVLYHWRMIPGSTSAVFDSKSYADEAGKIAITNYLKRNKIEADVLEGQTAGIYRVKRKIINTPMVSIIIPFKDNIALLETCLDSIYTKSTYKNFEILAINNNSTEKETFDYIKKYENEYNNIKFIDYNIPFNYSAINNYAVTKAKGEHLILLNNDIEIISPDWIEALLEHSQRPEVGVVGAKLYYPDDTLQHAGVIIGLGGVAGHSHKHFPGDTKGYFYRPYLLQNLSAVTAACLMVKTSIYNKLKGLNEGNLAIAFNDVDFCLRVREEGYLIVYTPYCEAYHHESISRGYEDTPEKRERFKKEVLYIKARHKETIAKGDPYYNPNLTLAYENFSLAKVHKKWWHKIFDFKRKKSGKVRNAKKEISFIKESGLFDIDYYLKNNSDIKNSKMDPIHHFCKHGCLEHRSPNKNFNFTRYQLEHPTIKTQYLFHHFIISNQPKESLTEAKFPKKWYR